MRVFAVCSVERIKWLIHTASGDMVGAILGVILIHQTREFVSWRWNRDELIVIVIGVLLVASVLVHRALSPSSRNDGG